MSLITPLFLFGLLGIGLPVWLHRLQTQTTEREKFSSTMFLEPAKHRIHVKRKLKYLLLLAMRILFLMLLVFAFARPVLMRPPQPAITADDTHHVIVVDTSFSMNQGNSFNQAMTMAGDIIDGMEGGDQASIFTASSRVRTIAEPSSDKTALHQALAGLKPDNGRLDLGAMITALNTLIVQSQANYVIHVISDFQQTGQPVRFADLIPEVINGRPVTLEIDKVTSLNTPNWAVDSVVVGNGEASVSVRGFNTDATEKTVQLAVNGQVQGQQSLTVPASGQAVFKFDGLTFESGDNKIDVNITPADDLTIDDHRFTVLDNSPPAPVLLLTNNPDSLAVTYISSALETAPRPYHAEVTAIQDLDARILQRYPWVIIEDIGTVNQSLADALTSYVNDGGAILAGLGSSNFQAVPVTGNPVTSIPRLGNARKGIMQIDSSHPALSQTSGWSNVAITTYVPIQAASGDSVLITLNSGVPFLLEHDMGRGRVLLLNSRLDNTWTDLPVKPVFVSFMAEAAKYLSNENVLLREQVADSFLQLQASGGASGQVFDPEGKSLLALEDTTQTQEIQLNQIGYYQVFTPGGEVLVAVNPDIRESDLTVMDAQALLNWQNTVAGAGNTVNVTDTQTAANSQEDTVEVEIWRVLLIILVIIVLTESLLGNRYLSFRTGTP